MMWLAAGAGLLLIVFGVQVLEHRTVLAHVVAGVIFVVAGLLFMLPVFLP